MILSLNFRREFKLFKGVLGKNFAFQLRTYSSEFILKILFELLNLKFF